MTNAPNPKDLEAAIRTLRQEYIASGISLYDIGNGHCYDFAEEIMNRVFPENWRHLEGRHGWQTLESEQLYRCPPGAEDTIDAVTWDWDMLSEHWDIDVPFELRAQHDAIIIHQPAHCWIYLDGLHYDCEHPEGVESFFKLNFFRRHIEGVGFENAQAAPVPVRVQRLSDVVCPVTTPPWPNVTGCLKGAVWRALQAEAYRAEPVDHEACIELHAQRIAWLIRYGWQDPIHVDLGVPNIPGWHPFWPVADGNHRLAAAILMGKSFIAAEVSGSLDTAEELLGLSQAA